MMEPARVLLTEKEFARIQLALDEKRTDEIYLQYPWGRVSVVVRKLDRGMQIKAVADYEGKSHKISCCAVDALRRWVFKVRCDGCAYFRTIASNTGCGFGCHYLLDNGKARERDVGDVCLSKSDKRTTSNWDTFDLCRPLEVTVDGEISG